MHKKEIQFFSSLSVSLLSSDVYLAFKTIMQLNRELQKCRQECSRNLDGIICICCLPIQAVFVFIMKFTLFSFLVTLDCWRPEINQNLITSLTPLEVKVHDHSIKNNFKLRKPKILQLSKLSKNCKPKLGLNLPKSREKEEGRQTNRA